MCKEKATGEILAMKIRKKDVVVGEDGNIYTLKEKRVLFIFLYAVFPTSSRSLHFSLCLSFCAEFQVLLPDI